MALPVITDTIRTAVEGHLPNGHRWANVLHFRKTGILTFTGAIAILDPILIAKYQTDSGGNSALITQLHPSAGIDDIRYTPLDGASATTVNTHALNGTNATDALGAALAVVITLRTALRGRAHRGRVYWPAGNEAGEDANGLPTWTGRAAGQWNDLITALAGSGVSLVVASYLHSTAQDVVNCTSRAVWGSQRRRNIT